MNPGGGAQVRPMLASDIDAMVALDRECPDAPHWRREAYLAAIDPAGDSALRRIGLIAEWNESFAGFTVLRCVAAPGGNEVELESMAVCPAMRRRGFGGILLDSAIDAARKLGAQRLDLEVRASNTAAARLYGRAGFKETGRRRAYYHNPEEDAVLMSIRL
jgi:ribosomal-protein-alanine N-acetyltransferase